MPNSRLFIAGTAGRLGDKPDKFAAWEGLGNAFADRGEAHQAIQCWRKAAALWPVGVLHLAKEFASDLATFGSEPKMQYDGSGVSCHQTRSKNFGATLGCTRGLVVLTNATNAVAAKRVNARTARGEPFRSDRPVASYSRLPYRGPYRSDPQRRQRAGLRQ